MEKVKEGILYILEELTEDEFKRFKWCLKNHSSPGDLRAIPVFLLENADRLDIVDLMGQYYADPVQVAREVLKKIPRIDLLEQLPQTTPIEEGCAYLASALLSNTSHLKLPSAGLEDPHCELQTLRVEPAAVRWFSPGLRKYSCELTIDTNTVHRELILSDNNRKVTYVMQEDQSYPDHPDRFDYYCQLLCRTGLTGRCYWEVEWRGDVYVSVSYRGIGRKGGSDDCEFGKNDQSWSLICSDGGYYVLNNKTVTLITSSSSSSGRVAVYVDYPAGSLSFYIVSSDTLIHLHTFNTTFTEPLYPGFGFWSRSGSSVSLCSLPEGESPPGGELPFLLTT